MREILGTMTTQEQEQYKKYMGIFMQAMREFSKYTQLESEEDNKKLKESVDGYINLMANYIPNLKLSENLGNMAIRVFIIQEINRIYSER